jgi:hypothetical protein
MRCGHDSCELIEPQEICYSLSIPLNPLAGGRLLLSLSEKRKPLWYILLHDKTDTRIRRKRKFVPPESKTPKKDVVTHHPILCGQLEALSSSQHVLFHQCV